MKKEKTVQEYIDFGMETIRLMKKHEIDFDLYDTGFPGKIGIVVENKEMDSDMQRHITEAGYTYAGAYPKKQGCTLYTIDEEELKKIQNL